MDQNLTSRGTERIRNTYKGRASDWPPEDMDKLASMWNVDKATMTEIGNAVNRSRNSVAGQIRKMRARGVSLEERTGTPIKTGPRVRPSRTKVKEMVPSKPGIPRKHFKLPTPEEKPARVRLQIVESPIAVTFAELKPHHCKFPMGDPRQSDFRFCGGHRLENKPYCTEHTVRTEQQPFRRRVSPSTPGLT